MPPGTGTSHSSPPLTRPLAAPFQLNPQLHPREQGEQLHPPDGDTEAQRGEGPGGQPGTRTWAQSVPGSEVHWRAWPWGGGGPRCPCSATACPGPGARQGLLERLGLWPVRRVLGVSAGQASWTHRVLLGRKCLLSCHWPREGSEGGASRVFPISQCLSVGGGPGRGLCRWPSRWTEAPSPVSWEGSMGASSELRGEGD